MSPAVMSPFEYPSRPHRRRHGPLGYAKIASFREWLRDEFSFRCVYCLVREQWGRVTGEFDIDHFTPQAVQPGRVAEYDNLVYSCARCNAIKSSQVVPDPLSALIGENLRIQPDGIVETYTRDAATVIHKLDLNAPQMVAWRLVWIRIAELAKNHDETLYRRLMGFPNDMPNLGRLRPPGGNTRPEGIEASYYAISKRRTLPATY